VVPYSELSLNPLASPRRLFLHLPFGAPILATPGCAQLEEFEPLVVACASPDAFVRALERLRARNFDDGLREARWREATSHTWTKRAHDLREIIENTRRLHF
jgi:hypothetical protein